MFRATEYLASSSHDHITKSRPRLLQSEITAGTILKRFYGSGPIEKKMASLNDVCESAIRSTTVCLASLNSSLTRKLAALTRPNCVTMAVSNIEIG
jgi:hypothetical protein